MRKILIMALMAIFALSTPMEAQKVTREGNTFTQVKSTKKTLEETATPTEYQYVDSKGKVYQVFLSPSGKAFIWRQNQKTGELYPQYKPEIGKIINPKAYEPKEKEGK